MPAAPDNERSIALAVEYVGTGGIRKAVDERRIELGRQDRPREKARDCLREQLRGVFALERLPQLPDEIGVGQGAMPRVHAQPMMLSQGIEVMVLESGIQLARQHDGAKDLRIECDSGAIELSLEKRVIEARVVRHDQAPREHLREASRDVAKQRRVRGRLRSRIARGRSVA